MLLVSNIQRFCMHDGPGIRTTLFLKGCPFCCPWCCNPENGSFESQYYFKASECLKNQGKDCRGCADLLAASQVSEPSLLAGQRADRPSPCALALGTWGEWKDEDELFDLLMADKVYHQDSAGGITFSGGEPLSHPIEKLTTRLHQAGAHLAMETTLLAEHPNLKALLTNFSLLLVDAKIMDPEQSQKILSMPSENLRPNLRIALEAGCQIILRVPLIPGYTTHAENLSAIAALIQEFQLPHVHLMPFHHLGDEKCLRLGAKVMECEDLEADLPARYQQQLEAQSGVKVEVLSF